ncbi:MAG: hypothetical protein Q8P41_12560 [Pseudomonadota bacterium]|nr:hypothetical protein [Pseudomonadota bacterium]
MVDRPLGGCIDMTLPGVKSDIGDSGVFCEEEIDAELADDFADALVADGCRYALSAFDETFGVQVFLDVPAFADAAAGVPASVSYTLPDDTVRLEVSVGCELDEGWCDDSSSGVGFVSRTYTASTGTVGVEVTPDGEESDAIVTFTGVALADEFGDEAVLETTLEVRLYAMVE